MRGVALARFVLSLKARRSGLFGDVLRDTERNGPPRLTDGLCFAPSSVAASALHARDSENGDTCGLDDVLGDFVICNE